MKIHDIDDFIYKSTSPFHLFLQACIFLLITDSKSELNSVSMLVMPHATSSKYSPSKKLRQYGLSINRAAELMIQLLDETGCSNPVSLVRTVCESAKMGKSVSFQKAVEESLASKSHRRPRTITEIRYVTKRFMKLFPELKRKKINNITPADCRRYLESGFETIRQRHKARVILSGVFSVAIKRDWCSENPVSKVDAPILQERQIVALSLKQTRRLICEAQTHKHRACLPAVSLMLYAGIRPEEVKRLTWQEIDLVEGVITLQARHSKTGGARHVTIMPPLKKILSRYKHFPYQRICPTNWTNRWRSLRKQAGWNSATNPWQQDCLRHTYASYHAKHFRDLTALQWEMGHRSLHLLRTRYLNMQGITAKSVACFWA